MKRLQKLNLKLTQLSQSELSKKELNKLKGGGCCICGAGGGTLNASYNYNGDMYSAAGGYGWGY